ncbi:MAG: glycosyltransferase family 2 protein [Crocinitomicaceae bacterium]|nr:glycosyltransferase family 2 protein [Crocinitomicaceae bacterium]
MKLSATIITLNEERNIERCILSLKNVADEIIVLDSNSTDRTKEICLAHNVKFVKRDWEGYAASKNYLNSLANYDYILSIDADEAVDKELERAILKIKKESNPHLYSVNRMTNYCGKWIKYSGWYPDTKTRIFPKQECYWDGEFVHEELVYPEGSNIILLDGHLSHYSYYSFKEHRERADKYSTLTAQKMNKSGKKAGPLKPFLSGLARFVSMYFIKAGFLDGFMGLKIAQISAQSNVFKYKELRRLNKKA